MTIQDLKQKSTGLPRFARNDRKTGFDPALSERAGLTEMCGGGYYENVKIQMTNVKWETGRGINRNDKTMSIGEPTMPTVDGNVKKAKNEMTPLQKFATRLRVENPQLFRDLSSTEAHISGDEYVEVVEEDVTAAEQAWKQKEMEETADGEERLNVFEGMSDEQKKLTERFIVDDARNFLRSRFDPVASGYFGPESSENGRINWVYGDEERKGIEIFEGYGPVVFSESVGYRTSSVSMDVYQKTEDAHEGTTSYLDDYKIDFYYVDPDDNAIKDAVRLGRAGKVLINRGTVGISDLENVGVKGLKRLFKTTEGSKVDSGLISYLLESLITNDKIRKAIELKLSKIKEGQDSPNRANYNDNI